MTQSIIIFVIILIVQVVAAAAAKKKANEKKAFLEMQRLGQSQGQSLGQAPPISPLRPIRPISPLSPLSLIMQRPAQVAPRKDRFAAAQAKAERTSAARALPSARKAMPRSQQTFTSQIGSVRAVTKIANIGVTENPARRATVFGRAESISGVRRASRQALLHSTEDGEATSAQLARTVDAIRRGILRKNDSAGAPGSRSPIAPGASAVHGYGSLLRSRAKLRDAIVLGEILGPPVALR